MGQVFRLFDPVVGEGEDVELEVGGEALDGADVVVVCMSVCVQSRSSLRFTNSSMHSIFLIVPYPERIFVTSSKGVSPIANRFNSSIFSRSAYLTSASRRFPPLPIQVCEREVGHSSMRVDSWRKLSRLSGRIKLLARLGWRAEREALRVGTKPFLAVSSYWLSCLSWRVKAWTIWKMVRRCLFLAMTLRLMGWLQWGQASCLLVSTRSSSCMQGAQQLCWLMHITTGAYSSASNSHRHRKHSVSTLSRSSDWISGDSWAQSTCMQALTNNLFQLILAEFCEGDCLTPSIQQQHPEKKGIQSADLLVSAATKLESEFFLNPNLRLDVNLMVVLPCYAAGHHPIIINFNSQQTIYMLADIIITSNAAINPEQADPRPQTQDLICTHGSRFRVLSREFAGKSSMVAFWCVFWLIVTMLATALLLVFVQDLSPKIVFYGVILAAVVMCAFAIYQRRHLSKIMTLSIVNLAVCMTVASFFLIFSLPFTTVPICLAAAIQIVLSIKLIKQKGKFVLEAILLGELIVLALKSDGFLQITWNQSLIAFIPFFVFLGAAFVFILIYTILLKLYYFETYTIKKLSLLFLILNLACFTLILAIPLSRLFLDLDPIVLCILAMAVASSNSIFLWICSQDIALHFCVHKYEVFDHDKETKIELIPVKAPKRNLYRLSENWFGTEIKDSKLPMVSSSKYPECLVCTERQSDIVWLPCGHLSLCTPCCKDVIDNKMICCILCKQHPTNICRVVQRDHAELRLDQEMGLATASSEHSANVIEEYEVHIS